MRIRALLGALIIILGTATGLARSSFAQTYPVRQVRIVVPYGAGQGSDILARRFAEHFQQHFGRSFVVENRPGASGNIGSATVARAEPDGYTLLWGTNATHVANEFLFPSLGFDPVRDFEPIVGIARLGMVLSAAVGSGLRSPAELLALARSRPGEISVGVPSTTARAVLAMLRKAAGVELTLVPYTASGQALIGLMRGDVQATLDTVTASLGPASSGQVVPLAVSLGQRSGSLPDTPTFREASIDLEVEAWNALYAPRGTPPEVIRALNAATNKALADPGLRAMVIRDGVEPMGGTPEDLAEVMRRDRAKWEPVIRSLGMTPQ